MKKGSGLTLTELILVIVGMSILFVVAVTTFLIASKAIQKQEARIPAGEELAQGLQKAERELREPADGSIRQYNNIPHTLQYRDVENSNGYLLYLYSQDDPILDGRYVRTALYELRLAPLLGFVYGSGEILARYLMSPNAPNATDQARIRMIGNPGYRRIELIFTATEIPQSVSQKSEKVKMRLLVRPRNQGQSVPP